MIGIQVQLTLLNRLIATKHQQEQEQIPESPSPSPAPSSSSNQRVSRSRHSSISHTSTTAPLEEERSNDSSLNMDDGIRGSLNNVNVVESNNVQSGCTIS